MSDNVVTWKIFSGNIPVNPQELRWRITKFGKSAKFFGTEDEKLFWSRRMIDRFWSLVREGSRGPERLQFDMLSSCRLCSCNKALIHSFPLADTLTPSIYNCLIMVRFLTSICKSIFSSFSGFPNKKEREEISRVTNLVREEISIGICPTKPAWDKFRYVKFFNLLNPDGISELKLLTDKFNIRRLCRLKRVLELSNPPLIDSPFRSRPITCPSLSQVTPVHLQQSMLEFQNTSLWDFSCSNLRLFFSFSNDCCWSSTIWPETRVK